MFNVVKITSRRLTDLMQKKIAALFSSRGAADARLTLAATLTECISQSSYVCHILFFEFDDPVSSPNWPFETPRADACSHKSIGHSLYTDIGLMLILILYTVHYMLYTVYCIG